MTPVIPCQNVYGQHVPTQQPDTPTRIHFPCCKSKRHVPNVPTITKPQTLSYLMKCNEATQITIITKSSTLSYQMQAIKKSVSQMSQSSQRSTPCLIGWNTPEKLLSQLSQPSSLKYDVETSCYFDNSPCIML